jgi:hypothetical protein
MRIRNRVARVCEQCGARLEVICLDCGAAIPPEQVYQCLRCCARNQRGADRVADLARNAAAERRQLTIMFCDLVGSTAVSAKLDPEDLRDLIRQYQTLASAEIRRYDGSVAKFSGDGIGLLRLSEGARGRRRAHRARRSRHRRFRARGSRVARETSRELSVRVGIATGEVVVGDLVGDGVSGAMGGHRRDAQPALHGCKSVAEPNSVVISASAGTLRARIQLREPWPA